MNKSQSMNKTNAEHFGKNVNLKALRKLKALHHKKSVWFGLGMMGIVGWTIVTPTLSGALLGIWLDKHYPEPFSWTITGLTVGLFSGCIIAWRWMDKENEEINQTDDDE